MRTRSLSKQKKVARGHWEKDENGLWGNLGCGVAESAWLLLLPSLLPFLVGILLTLALVRPEGLELLALSVKALT